jgi:hypothetical protein
MKLGWLIALAAVSGAVAAHRAAAAMDSPPGATLPWQTYEAETAKTNGTILGPDFIGRTPAREASGRSCVRLAGTGDFVEFVAQADAQGLVVRYCIPDSPDGRGIDTTLGLYINGQSRAKLAMTSRLTWLYGKYPFNNQPASGSPRHFWDELRLMPDTIHKGDLIRLQKDMDDSAAEYLIDLIDLEAVPPPLPRPSDSLSVTDFGATGNGRTENRSAFQSAIAAAKEQHKSVWVPPGSFVVKGPIEVSDVAIHGAGMWYSTLVGVDDYTSDNRVAVYGKGSNVTLSDFAVTGKLNYRNDSEPNDGLGGSFGTGSVIRNIWVEHTKTGAWLVNTDGLLVEGCRFRDTIADGINLCVGMRNTTVRNCTTRGTGDDCFAMWPATYTKPTYTAGGNRFVHCTGQLPFLAQAFSIYGGEDNRVEDCEAIDIPYGAGLFASTTFPTNFGFRGTTTYRNVRLIRAGDADGAIATVANRLDLQRLRFHNIEAIDNPTDGIRFISMKGHALRDAEFDQVRIVNAGVAGAGCGIIAAAGAVGSASFSNVTVVNPKTAGWRNDAADFRFVCDDDAASGNASSAAGNESPVASAAK